MTRERLREISFSIDSAATIREQSPSGIMRIPPSEILDNSEFSFCSGASAAEFSGDVLSSLGKLGMPIVGDVVLFGTLADMPLRAFPVWGDVTWELAVCPITSIIQIDPLPRRIKGRTRLRIAIR